MRKFALSALPLLLAAPLALAAPQPQAPASMPKPAMQSGAPSVDSATLHKFAATYEDVRMVRAKYMIKFKTAKSDKDKAAIKQEATKDIKQHITKHMPVKQYIKVAKALQASPQLRQELNKILQADSKQAAQNPNGG